MPSHAELQDQAKKVTPVPKKEQDVPESVQKKHNVEEATRTGQKTAVVGGRGPTYMTPQELSQPKLSQQVKSDKPHQEESGFFGFGFSGARSRSPSPQPAVSAVSGKVLGFGSSFLSTASNLISSAVQDEPSTTPPTSRKVSSVSETTLPPGSRKGSTVSQSLFNNNTTSPSSEKDSVTTQGLQKSQHSKDTKPSIGQKQEEKTPSLQQSKELSNKVKEDKSETPTSKPLTKVCPLCKVELKKDQYNSCTECTNFVCNLCGFNPMPHENEMKWLCLACQIKKAPEPHPAQLQSHAKEVAPLKMDTPTPDASQKKRHLPADAVHKYKKPEVAGKQDNKKTLAETEQPNQREIKQHNIAEVAKSESQKTDPQPDKPGFFGFGFGGVRSRSPSPQPAVSAVSEKVLGFGSSILSSASNLMSTAIQDESSTTPSSSRKASTASQISDKTPPTSRKGSTVSQISSKVHTTPPSSRKGSTVSQTSVKTAPATSQKESEAAVNSKSIENTDSAKTKVAEKGEETTKGATPQHQRPGKSQDGHVPVSSEVPEESRGRSQSPLLPPAASAVSGKVLGFGSSLFSSASNLISSALDEPSTTPPTSRKGSTSSQLSAKTTTPPSSRKGSSVSQTSDKITTPPSSRKGSGVSQTSLKTSTPPASSKGSDVSPKMLPSDDKKVHTENIQEQIKKDDKKSMASQAQPTIVSDTKDRDLPETTRTESTKSFPKACPLCKVDLQKEPPNYNTCTQCKNTVCNLCGFNPMPHETEKKEWLCLNCQMQRAQAETDKVPPPVSPLKKATPTSVPPQKKPLDSTGATEKEKTALSEGATPGSRKASAVPPTQKPPQQQDIKNPVQPTQKDDTVSTKSTSSPKAASTKEESGLFGFGRSRSPSPQPAASSVSGKVFGFGSSLLSSASNLISTTVQDESSTTLLATQQQVSSASQTPVMNTLTPATSQKGSADVSPKQGAKSVENQQKDKTPEENMTEVQGKAVKEGDDMSETPKACPLCKADIMRNPPNYRTCTTCKSTVCNLCGFNPMPHQTEVRK
uniref:Zinc finger piccolo-type domain-containing protein n=1 Tax=Cyprinus carpio TaxID=7962 RepID=A0A8C2GNP5_CYPCA